MVGTPLATVLADHAIGHVQVPGGEIVNAGLQAAATVTNVTLLDAPIFYDRETIANAPEQLVEGHTVFVTWDIVLVPNVTNWSAEIIGDIECQHRVDVEGQKFLGLPIVPSRINEAHVECRAGETVIVSPDPFYDSNDTYGNAYGTQMAPTGVQIPFTAPNGMPGVATEYVYEMVYLDWLGNEQARRTLYAWEVPVLEPWIHIDGTTKRWLCPIPMARVMEMGVSHFSATPQSSLDELPLPG